MHILHIFLHIQCIFVCIFICIFCIFYRCIVRIFCILYTTYCAYCAYSGSKKPFSGFSLFIATTAWSPIPGPSCSRTTTYNHHRRLLIYRRKLRESLHGKGYCPCSTHWNKRKASQYGGHWNHIQNLRLFTAFVDYFGLALS